MRLHLIGFPHTRIGDDLFSTCAYTSKIEKFSKMGWDDLVVYATEGSVVPEGVELVECLTEKERHKLFGRANPRKPPEWPTDEQWQHFNVNAAIEVTARSSADDLLLLSGGLSQALVASTNSHLTCCENGVGYEGVFANFAAYESYAWQHHIYAKYGWDGRWFDRVIPNYFDTDEFPYLNDRSGEHLLYVGRVVQRKGLQAAMDIAKASGRKLKVAGPGPTKWKKGKFIQAPEVTIYGDVEYIGVLSADDRAKAMSEAYALLAPTVYVEPFGGVVVEAMMCGTPVVATDWGAFTESVVNDVSGYRFRTLQEAVTGVTKAGNLKPLPIQNYAKNRYSLKAVKPQFENWFDALGTLREKGWYELR